MDDLRRKLIKFKDDVPKKSKNKAFNSRRIFSADVMLRSIEAVEATPDALSKEVMDNYRKRLLKKFNQDFAKLVSNPADDGKAEEWDDDDDYVPAPAPLNPYAAPFAPIGLFIGAPPRGPPIARAPRGPPRGAPRGAPRGVPLRADADEFVPLEGKEELDGKDDGVPEVVLPNQAEIDRLHAELKRLRPTDPFEGIKDKNNILELGPMVFKLNMAAKAKEDKAKAPEAKEAIIEAKEAIIEAKEAIVSADVPIVKEGEPGSESVKIEEVAKKSLVSDSLGLTEDERDIFKEFTKTKTEYDDSKAPAATEGKELIDTKEIAKAEPVIEDDEDEEGYSAEEYAAIEKERERKEAEEMKEAEDRAKAAVEAASAKTASAKAVEEVASAKAVEEVGEKKRILDINAKMEEIWESNAPFTCISSWLTEMKIPIHKLPVEKIEESRLLVESAINTIINIIGSKTTVDETDYKEINRFLELSLVRTKELTDYITEVEVKTMNKVREKNPETLPIVTSFINKWRQYKIDKENVEKSYQYKEYLPKILDKYKPKKAEEEKIVEDADKPVSYLGALQKLETQAGDYYEEVLERFNVFLKYVDDFRSALADYSFKNNPSADILSKTVESLRKGKGFTPVMSSIGVGIPDEKLNTVSRYYCQQYNIYSIQRTLLHFYIENGKNISPFIYTMNGVFETFISNKTKELYEKDMSSSGFGQICGKFTNYILKSQIEKFEKQFISDNPLLVGADIDIIKAAKTPQDLIMKDLTKPDFNQIKMNAILSIMGFFVKKGIVPNIEEIKSADNIVQSTLRKRHFIPISYEKLASSIVTLTSGAVSFPKVHDNILHTEFSLSEHDDDDSKYESKSDEKLPDHIPVHPTRSVEYRLLISPLVFSDSFNNINRDFPESVIKKYMTGVEELKLYTDMFMKVYKSGYGSHTKLFNSTIAMNFSGKNRKMNDFVKDFLINRLGTLNLELIELEMFTKYGEKMRVFNHIQNRLLKVYTIPKAAKRHAKGTLDQFDKTTHMDEDVSSDEQIREYLDTFQKNIVVDFIEGEDYKNIFKIAFYADLDRIFRRAVINGIAYSDRKDIRALRKELEEKYLAMVREVWKDFKPIDVSVIEKLNENILGTKIDVNNIFGVPELPDLPSDDKSKVVLEEKVESVKLLSSFVPEVTPASVTPIPLFISVPPETKKGTPASVIPIPSFIDVSSKLETKEDLKAPAMSPAPETIADMIIVAFGVLKNRATRSLITDTIGTRLLTSRDSVKEQLIIKAAEFKLNYKLYDDAMQDTIKRLNSDDDTLPEDVYKTKRILRDMVEECAQQLNKVYKLGLELEVKPVKIETVILLVVLYRIMTLPLEIMENILYSDEYTKMHMMTLNKFQPKIIEVFKDIQKQELDNVQGNIYGYVNKYNSYKIENRTLDVYNVFYNLGLGRVAFLLKTLKLTETTEQKDIDDYSKKLDAVLYSTGLKIPSHTDLYNKFSTLISIDTISFDLKKLNGIFISTKIGIDWLDQKWKVLHPITLIPEVKTSAVPDIISALKLLYEQVPERYRHHESRFLQMSKSLNENKTDRLFPDVNRNAEVCSLALIKYLTKYYTEVTFSSPDPKTEVLQSLKTSIDNAFRLEAFRRFIWTSPVNRELLIDLVKINSNEESGPIKVVLDLMNIVDKSEKAKEGVIREYLEKSLGNVYDFENQKFKYDDLYVEPMCMIHVHVLILQQQMLNYNTKMDDITNGLSGIIAKIFPPWVRHKDEFIRQNNKFYKEISTEIAKLIKESELSVPKDFVFSKEKDEEKKELTFIGESLSELDKIMFREEKFFDEYVTIIKAALKQTLKNLKDETEQNKVTEKISVKDMRRVSEVVYATLTIVQYLIEKVSLIMNKKAVAEYSVIAVRSAIRIIFFRLIILLVEAVEYSIFKQYERPVFLSLFTEPILVSLKTPFGGPKPSVTEFEKEVLLRKEKQATSLSSDDPVVSLFEPVIVNAYYARIDLTPRHVAILGKSDSEFRDYAAILQKYIPMYGTIENEIGTVKELIKLDLMFSASDIAILNMLFNVKGPSLSYINKIIKAADDKYECESFRSHIFPYNPPLVDVSKQKLYAAEKEVMEKEYSDYQTEIVKIVEAGKTFGEDEKTTQTSAEALGLDVTKYTNERTILFDCLSLAKTGIDSVFKILTSYDAPNIGELGQIATKLMLYRCLTLPIEAMFVQFKGKPSALLRHFGKLITPLLKKLITNFIPKASTEEVMDCSERFLEPGIKLWLEKANKIVMVPNRNRQYKYMSMLSEMLVNRMINLVEIYTMFMCEKNIPIPQKWSILLFPCDYTLKDDSRILSMLYEGGVSEHIILDLGIFMFADKLFEEIKNKNSKKLYKGGNGGLPRRRIINIGMFI